MRRKTRSPYFTTATRASVCPETNELIQKGDRILYHPVYHIAYSVNSKTAEQVRAQDFARAYNMADADY